MRVVLKVLSGPRQGAKMLLQPNQVLHIGRTDWADVSFPFDSKMSGVHFEIKATGDCCMLYDLESINGTRVNGEPVQQILLRGGDQIVAGETEFVVNIEGDNPDAVMLDPGKRTIAAAPSSVSHGPTRATTFTARRCPSGIMNYSGTVAGDPPTRLAGKLCSISPLYMLADVQRQGFTLPPACDTEPLHDWLPEAAVADGSPVLVSGVVSDTLAQLFEAAWGANSLVCIYSARDKHELLEQLRDAGRVTQDDGGVLGYCWPKVIGPLLENHSAEFVQRFLDGIDLILVEDPLDTEKWHIFGDESISDQLIQFGLLEEKESAADPDA